MSCSMNYMLWLYSYQNIIQHFISVYYITAYLHWRILRYWIYQRITYLKVYLTIYSHPYYHWESWTWVTVNCQLYQTGVYDNIIYYEVICTIFIRPTKCRATRRDVRRLAKKLGVMSELFIRLACWASSAARLCVFDLIGLLPCNISRAHFFILIYDLTSSVLN